MARIPTGMCWAALCNTRTEPSLGEPDNHNPSDHAEYSAWVRSYRGHGHIERLCVGDTNYHPTGKTGSCRQALIGVY